jgi:hypothetical protein
VRREQGLWARSEVVGLPEPIVGKAAVRSTQFRLCIRPRGLRRRRNMANAASFNSFFRAKTCVFLGAACRCAALSLTSKRRPFRRMNSAWSCALTITSDVAAMTHCAFALSRTGPGASELAYYPGDTAKGERGGEIFAAARA